MKFLLVSDIHLRPDNPVGRLDYLPEVQWDKLRSIFNIAQEHEVRGVIHAGDLFHKPRSWTTLHWALELFFEYPAVHWYTVRGQHDSYMNEKASEGLNFGILSKVGAIRELGPDAVYVEGESGLIALYGAGWGEEVPKIKDTSDFTILATHRSISDEEMVGIKTTSATRFIRLHRFDLVVCGDIHRAFVVTAGKKTLVNTGPMLRAEATEYNFQHEPHVMIFDTEDRSLSRVEIPHEPSDKILSRAHLDVAQETSEKLAEFVEGVQADFSPEASFKENLRLFIKANNISESVRIKIERVMEAERG